MPIIYLKSRRIRLPWFNILLVDPLEHIAGDRSIEEWVEANEDIWLDHVHPVQVLAQNRRQTHFSQLLQLVCNNNMLEHNTALDKCVRPFVKADGGMLFSYQNLGEERLKDVKSSKYNCSPVSLFEDLKLLTQKASEGGSDNCPREWSLGQPAHLRFAV